MFVCLQYLKILPTAEARRKHCLVIEDFLTSPTTTSDDDVTARSHQLLEIVLYRVHLQVLVGRCTSAIHALQVRCA